MVEYPQGFSLAEVFLRYVFEDHSLITALMRVFAPAVTSQEAHHFLCLIDSNKRLRAAYREYVRQRDQLRQWGTQHGYYNEAPRTLARRRLVEMLQQHSFHDEIKVRGVPYRRWTSAFMQQIRRRISILE